MEQFVTQTKFTVLNLIALFYDYINTTSLRDEGGIYYIIHTSAP